jgi:hypothetical protein
VEGRVAKFPVFSGENFPVHSPASSRSAKIRVGGTIHAAQECATAGAWFKLACHLFPDAKVLLDDLGDDAGAYGASGAAGPITLAIKLPKRANSGLGSVSVRRASVPLAACRRDARTTN